MKIVKNSHCSRCRGNMVYEPHEDDVYCLACGRRPPVDQTDRLEYSEQTKKYELKTMGQYAGMKE